MFPWSQIRLPVYTISHSTPMKWWLEKNQLLILSGSFRGLQTPTCPGSNNHSQSPHNISNKSELLLSQIPTKRCQFSVFSSKSKFSLFRITMCWWIMVARPPRFYLVGCFNPFPKIWVISTNHLVQRASEKYLQDWRVGSPPMSADIGGDLFLVVPSWLKTSKYACLSWSWLDDKP